MSTHADSPSAGGCEVLACSRPASVRVSYPYRRNPDKRVCDRHAEIAVEEADAEEVGRL